MYNHDMKVLGILQMITEYNLLEILEKPNEKDFLIPSIREDMEEKPKK